MMVATGQTALRKTAAPRSYRVAMRRQSLSRQKARSMAPHLRQVLRSKGVLVLSCRVVRNDRQSTARQQVTADGAAGAGGSGHAASGRRPRRQPHHLRLIAPERRAPPRAPAVSRREAPRAAHFYQVRSPAPRRRPQRHARQSLSPAAPRPRGRPAAGRRVPGPDRARPRASPGRAAAGAGSARSPTAAGGRWRR